MKAIGIALGPDRLVAVLPGGRRLETADLADLGQAFADLRKTGGLTRARVSVALIPPLVDVRSVSLPPMREDERRRVLARDAARYFVGVRDPQVVGSQAPFAAAAPASLVERIEAAVAAVGWTLAAVMPAQVAWAASVRDGQLVARLPHATELMRVDRGRVVERRRLRAGESVPAATEIDSYIAAAQHAPRCHALEVCSDARRTARGRSARRLALALSAAAVGCLLLAAGIDFWGLERELAAVQARRATLAPEVARAIRARDSVNALAATVTTLEALESATPRWSAFFADLADYLPRDAHVVAFRAMGDSVALVGIAREAAGVFQGLERMPRLAAVRADGTIRQDVGANGVVREHFGVSARWTSP